MVIIKSDETEPPSSGYLLKIKSVLWKCLQVRKRHYVLTTATIFLPVILFAAVAGIRAHIGEVHQESRNATTYNQILREEDLYRHYKLDIESSVVYYAPETEFTNDLMRRVQLKLDILNHGIQAFETEEDLVDEYIVNQPKICYAVIFHGLGEGAQAPKHLDYDIRYNDNNIRWRKNALYRKEGKYVQGGGSVEYFHSGVMLLQMAIDTNFIRTQKEFNLTLAMQEFPYPPHKEPSDVNTTVFGALPIVTLISFILICPTTLKNIVDEKHSGIKELMKMMGLPTFVMWTSWFIEAMLHNAISIVIIVMCIKIDFGARVRVLELCHPFILGLFLFLYCSASTAFCFLISTICNNPNFTTIIGIVIWFATYIAAAIIRNLFNNIPMIISLAACLFPNFAMCYGYKIIAGYEYQDVGLNWNNINKPSADGINELSMVHILAMLFFDVFILMVLAIYIDSINPGHMGAGKPFYYPLLFIKNMFKKETKQRVGTFTKSSLLLNRKRIVKIRDLNKIYERPVLDKFSIDFYAGEITALLGPNGAGKTTILSILSGMKPPTSGQVTILDNQNNTSYDVVEDLDQVRYLVGVCPQQNLLLQDLSVRNHLKFVTMINGIKNADEKIENLLRYLQLDQQKNATPDQLSGGMRRKLCLGMALIKSPKVLILDEPTASLDTLSRRQIWNILNQVKQDANFRNCSIILSTHFMDEAELLADRVAIIDHGTCIAHGTPEDLKQRHNTGINLTVISEEKDAGEEQVKLVYGAFNGKVVKEKSVSYRLPNDTAKLHKVVELFDQLKKDGGIEDFMVMNTSIDDVFTSISKNKKDVEEDGVDCGRKVDMESLSKTLSQNKGTKPPIRWIMFQAHQKFIFKMKKNYLLAGTLCLLSAIFSIFLSTPHYITNSNINSTIPLDLSQYGDTHVFYNWPNSSGDSALVGNFTQLTIDKLGKPVAVHSVSEALINEGLQNIENYNQYAVVAVEFNETSDGMIVNAMYSNAAIHGAPISWNLVINAVAKAYLGEEYAISVQNRQLQNLAKEILTKHIEMQIAFIWTAFLCICLPVFTSLFIIYPHIQRTNTLFQLFAMAGVRKRSYWTMLFLFDYILYLCLCGLVVLFIIIFNNIIFNGISELALFTLILITNGFAAIPMIYLFSFFNNVIVATSRLYLMKMMFFLVFLIFESFEYSGNEAFETVGKGVLFYVFTRIPENYVLLVMFDFCKKAVWKYNWMISDDESRELRCGLDPNPCCEESNSPECIAFQSYTEQYLKLAYFYMFLLAAIAICSWRHIPWWRKKQTAFRDNSGFLIENLKKRYNAHAGVQNLNFKIDKGNCFGLLGMNGSGKTTTFRLLTNTIKPQKGDAVIDDSSLTDHTEAYMSKIGYCPQVDAQHDVFTVREMLMLFGELRAYPEVKRIVDELINALGLNKYADEPCGKCSGGTRRKLNVAISLIVSPVVIMLDEPTCGVDPVSRRHLWSFLDELKKTSKMIFLTSHSLQECEVLCDSVLILNKGEVLVQKTAVSKLKKDFGDIYTVEVRLNESESDRVDEIVNDFLVQFADSKGLLQQNQHFLLKFSVSAKIEMLSLLTELEALKRKHANRIVDYVVSMPNLEQIFMHIINEKVKTESNEYSNAENV